MPPETSGRDGGLAHPTPNDCPDLPWNGVQIGVSGGKHCTENGREGLPGRASSTVDTDQLEKPKLILRAVQVQVVARSVAGLLDSLDATADSQAQQQRLEIID